MKLGKPCLNDTVVVIKMPMALRETAKYHAFMEDYPNLSTYIRYCVEQQNIINDSKPPTKKQIELDKRYRKKAEKMFPQIERAIYAEQKAKSVKEEEITQ